MNVFALSPGRCGSKSFALASAAATNFTASHESRVSLWGDERLNYPPQHIEADNRLTWYLGGLSKKYGAAAHYVHLTRDPEEIAQSYNQRWHHKSSIVRAFRDGVLIDASPDPLSACREYVNRAVENIEYYLRDMPNVHIIRVSCFEEDFSKFWDKIEAQGDKKLAIETLRTKHNQNVSVVARVPKPKPPLLSPPSANSSSPVGGLPRAGTVDHLMGNHSLFRFGFVSSEGDIQGDDVWRSLRWRRETVNNRHYWLHPDTKLQVVSGRVFIGDVYNFDHTASTVESLTKAFGRFVVIDGDEFYGDAFGSRSMFYADGIVASHSALIAHVQRRRRGGAAIELMQSKDYLERVVRYLPGDITAYDEVYACVPNHSYSPNSGQRRYWPRAMRQVQERQVVVSQSVEYLRDLAEATKHRSLVFGITGGVDTRAGLAAFGDNVRGVTWTTGYLKKSERPIVDAITEQRGLAHVYLNPLSFSGDDVSRRNAGNIRKPSRITAGMASIASPEDIFVRGYGGEIMRGFYKAFLKRPMTSLDPAEMVRTYGHVRSPDYLRACDKAFTGMVERADYRSKEVSSFDPNDIFYWEHRMGMWGSAMLNEMDSALGSLVAFNQRHLYESCLSLRDEDRGKTLMKDICTAIDPLLSSIPYE